MAKKKLPRLPLFEKRKAEERTEYARQWYLKNREKILARTKAQRKAWTEDERRRRIEQHYYRAIRRIHGLTKHEYEGLLRAQGGVCAICRQPEIRQWKGKTAKLAIDHDHSTGNVRGLLCGACNTGLGSFEDAIDRLKAAIQYLKKGRDNGASIPCDD